MLTPDGTAPPGTTDALSRPREPRRVEPTSSGVAPPPQSCASLLLETWGSRPNYPQPPQRCAFDTSLFLGLSRGEGKIGIRRGPASGNVRALRRGAARPATEHFEHFSDEGSCGQ